MEPIARAFPDLDPSRVVHEDDDLLVVDKPAGAAFQAVEPGDAGDLPARVAAWLAGRAGLPEDAPRPYVGVHQRLDRETSGVVVFTKRREANAAIAKAFERRDVAKRYLAAVASAPRKDAFTLEHVLVVDGETSRAARPGERGGKRAVTHVRVRARGPEGRALLELDLETGRTHQARAQLALAGMPLAGDVAYGGPPASRLLLHAERVEVPHPASGRRLAASAAAPPSFARWLAEGAPGEALYDAPALLREALSAARERRFGLARTLGPDGAPRTTAFRLVHEEGDALPRLAVDVYGAHAVVQLYGDDGPWASAARRDRVLDAVAELGFEGVYLKVRPQQANTLVDTRREALAPAAPVRGSAAPDPLVVREDGLELLVRLGDGLSTGVFLDHRRARGLVRREAGGRSVLNLFAYACGFTLAAAEGGARRTVSVDASSVALERGHEMLRRAGHGGEAHAFVAEDAFAYLPRAARKGERFDLVILDPPSYATTKARRFVAESDYGELAALALAVLAPGGTLLASTNHRKISYGKFRKMLRAGAEEAGVVVASLRDVAPGLDHPPRPGAEPFLKACLLRTAPGGAAAPTPRGPAPPRRGAPAGTAAGRGRPGGRRR